MRSRAICAVYIVTNARHTVLYTGVTSDLLTRIYQHKHGVHPSGFSRLYNAFKLVYFETTPSITTAIAREKQIKGWLRRRKIELIEAINPHWNDLSSDWTL